MKAGRELEIPGSTPLEGMRYILRIRFAECLQRAPSLLGEDDEQMHAFRLACKRLRYSIERFSGDLPQLQEAAQLLTQMTDELGAAHDAVVLQKRSERLNGALVAARARRDRNRHVDSARRVWAGAFHRKSPFARLADFTGFTWEPR